MLQYTSAYTFVGNNPVNTIDIGGMEGFSGGQGGYSSGGGGGGPSYGGGGGGYGGSGGYGANYGGRSSGMNMSFGGGMSSAYSGGVMQASMAGYNSSSYTIGINRGGNGLPEGKAYSGIINGEKVSFKGSGPANYITSNSNQFSAYNMTSSSGPVSGNSYSVKGPDEIWKTATASLSSTPPDQFHFPLEPLDVKDAAPNDLPDNDHSTLKKFWDEATDELTEKEIEKGFEKALENWSKIQRYLGRGVEKIKGLPVPKGPMLPPIFNNPWYNSWDPINQNVPPL